MQVCVCVHKLRLQFCRHVLVGRSMAYCITCEARHMCEFRMRHLSFVVWKSEPEPEHTHA